MSTALVIKLTFFVFAAIIALANKKEEKEKISTLKQSNDTLSLTLRIVAWIAFDHRRKIDIDNLSNRERNILSIIFEFGNEFGVKEKDDIEILLRSFIEISNDQSVYDNSSTMKDIEILLEREYGKYNLLDYIFRVCMSISLDEKGGLIENKKDKLKFLHKNLGIKYNIFNDGHESRYNSSSEANSKNEFEKYCIAMLDRGFVGRYKKFISKVEQRVSSRHSCQQRTT